MDMVVSSSRVGEIRIDAEIAVQTLVIPVFNITVINHISLSSKEIIAVVPENSVDQINPVVGRFIEIYSPVAPGSAVGGDGAVNDYGMRGISGVKSSAESSLVVEIIGCVVFDNAVGDKGR